MLHRAPPKFVGLRWALPRSAKHRRASQALMISTEFLRAPHKLRQATPVAAVLRLSLTCRWASTSTTKHCQKISRNFTSPSNQWRFNYGTSLVGLMYSTLAACATCCDFSIWDRASRFHAFSNSICCSFWANLGVIGGIGQFLAIPQKRKCDFT